MKSELGKLSKDALIALKSELRKPKDLTKIIDELIR